MTDPAALSARELSDRVRRGVLKARDVIGATLDRIDRVNPGLNAIVQGCHDEAMREAEALDARIARGGSDRRATGRRARWRACRSRSR